MKENKKMRDYLSRLCYRLGLLPSRARLFSQSVAKIQQNYPKAKGYKLFMKIYFL
jgi:hypothetical protein